MSEISGIKKKFFEEKENLQQAERAMQLVTQKYNELLKSFDINQLLNTAIIYDHKKAQTQYLLSTNNTQIDEEDRAIIDENFSQYIRNTFGIECIASDIRKLIEESNITSKPVLDVINLYKKELSSTYMKYSPVLRHATNVGGLSELNASQNRENQYLNEIVNAVFASSGYNDMENYIGRANVGGMQVVGDIVVYPKNPFEDKNKIKEDGNVKLKDKVYLYSMDVSKFEPVVDFRRDKDGNYKLDFDQEWISRNDSVECECEIIDGIPKEAFKQKHFFYKNEKIDVRTLITGKSKEEITKNLLVAINSGKLGYINGELGIEEAIKNEEANVKPQNNIQTNNNQFSWKQKVAQFLQGNSVLMNIPFIEKFVNKQLNVLSTKQEQGVSDRNSSRESLANLLSNNGEYRSLPQIQRMSDPEKLARMQRTMEQNQQVNEDNGPRL